MFEASGWSRTEQQRHVRWLLWGRSAAAMADLCWSAGKEVPPEVEMSIPGLDWGVDEVMGKETKKVPQKKVPYAKPIPAQFQQVAHLSATCFSFLQPEEPAEWFWVLFCRPGRRTRYQ